MRKNKFLHPTLVQRIGAGMGLTKETKNFGREETDQGQSLAELKNYMTTGYSLGLAAILGLCSVFVVGGINSDYYIAKDGLKSKPQIPSLVACINTVRKYRDSNFLGKTASYGVYNAAKEFLEEKAGDIEDMRKAERLASLTPDLDLVKYFGYTDSQF